MIDSFRLAEVAEFLGIHYSRIPARLTLDRLKKPEEQWYYSARQCECGISILISLENLRELAKHYDKTSVELKEFVQRINKKRQESYYAKKPSAKPHR